MHAIGRTAFVIAILSVPVWMHLGSFRIFEEEKALLIRWLGAAALGSLVASVAGEPGRTRFRRIGRHPLCLAIGALTAISVLAALASDLPESSWLGASYRRHGVVTWLGLVALGLMAAVTIHSRDARRTALFALIASSIWPSLYAIAQAGGLDPLDWTNVAPGRSGSTAGNAMLLGSFLALVLPLTVAASADAWGSPRGAGTQTFAAVLSAITVLQIAALVASGSRGPVIGAAAGVLAIGVAATSVRIRRVIALVAIVAFIIGGAAMIARQNAAPATNADGFFGRSSSVVVRLLIWRAVGEALREAPSKWVAGFGPETMGSRLYPHYHPAFRRLEGTAAAPDRAHNDLLDWLFAAGVLGFGAQLLVWILLARAARARSRAPGEQWLWRGVVGALAAHVVDLQFGIATVATRLIVFTLAGFAIGADSLTNARAPETSRRALVPPKSAPGDVRMLMSFALASGALAALPIVLPHIWPWLVSVDASPAFQVAVARQSYLSTALFVLIAAVLISAARFGQLRVTSRETIAVMAALAAVWPVTVEPSRADVVHMVAATFERAARWPEAATAFAAATDLQPARPEFHAGRARALIQVASQQGGAEQGQTFRAASVVLERAAALDRFDPHHSRNLASLHRVWARHDGAQRLAHLALAERHYADATRKAPGMATLWIEWANLALERRDVESAKSRVARALALDDTQADAYVMRAVVHASEGRRTEALADYDRALALEPTAAAALRGRELMLRAPGPP